MKSITLALALVALSLGACQSQDTAKEPTVTFVSPADGAEVTSPFEVCLAAEGIEDLDHKQRAVGRDRRQSATNATARDGAWCMVHGALLRTVLSADVT